MTLHISNLALTGFVQTVFEAALPTNPSSLIYRVMFAFAYRHCSSNGERRVSFANVSRVFLADVCVSGIRFRARLFPHPLTIFASALDHVHFCSRPSKSAFAFKDFGAFAIAASWFRLEELGGSHLLCGLARLIMCIAEVPFFCLSGPMIRRIGVRGVIAWAQLAYLVRFIYYAVSGHVAGRKTRRPPEMPALRYVRPEARSQRNAHRAVPRCESFVSMKYPCWRRPSNVAGGTCQMRMHSIYFALGNIRSAKTVDLM